MAESRFSQYLRQIEKPHLNLCRIDFLQPDNSVAFTLDNQYKNGYNITHDSRAFIQDGSLSVSLQNGTRRQASITLSNIDGAFDYSINKIWFGQKVAIYMGVQLPDNSYYYIPQGVFYINTPQNAFSFDSKTIHFNLIDKWSYLDGSLFGTLDNSYQVNRDTNIFEVIQSVLKFSKYDFNTTTNPNEMIDSVQPIFTDYYNGKTYQATESDGSITTNIPMLSTPYQIICEGGNTLGNLILELNAVINGLIGYDSTGALRIEPSQDDISDIQKSVLFNFNSNNSVLTQITETINNNSVYNDVYVVGQGLSNKTVWARAVNNDPTSPVSVQKMGKRNVLRIEKSDYWNTKQCADFAQWTLKRQSVLSRSISLSCSPIYHLRENGLISVQRTDKKGTPIEKHLIQSYTLPLSQTGSMSINGISVSDIPQFTVTTSTSEQLSRVLNLADAELSSNVSVQETGDTAQNQSLNDFEIQNNSISSDLITEAEGETL